VPFAYAIEKRPHEGEGFKMEVQIEREKGFGLAKRVYHLWRSKSKSRAEKHAG